MESFGTKHFYELPKTCKGGKRLKHRSWKMNFKGGGGGSSHISTFLGELFFMLFYYPSEGFKADWESFLELKPPLRQPRCCQCELI